MWRVVEFRKRQHSHLELQEVPEEQIQESAPQSVQVLLAATMHHKTHEIIDTKGVQSYTHIC